jgi:hypothetical protein
MWPLETAVAASLQAVAAIVNGLLLIVLVLITKAYADATKALAEDTRKLAAETSASVANAGAEREARRTGLLRAVAAEVQRLGTLARHMKAGGGLPEFPSTPIMDRNIVELASVLPAGVSFEAQEFARNLPNAGNLWTVQHALPDDVKADVAYITDRVERESQLISAMLIEAIKDEAKATAAAASLAEYRRAEYAHYADVAARNLKRD